MLPASKRLSAVWLISAWPAINFLMMNWADVAWRPLWAFRGIIAFTLALALLGHVLERRAEKRDRGGIVVVSWVALIPLLFCYSLLVNFLGYLSSRYDLLIPPLPVWAFLITLVVPLVFLSRRAPRFQKAASTFCFIVVGVSLVMLVNQIVTTTRSATKPYVAAPIQKMPLRRAGLNVYYILLDAYAGPRGMKEVVGYDNDAFYARMAERGFVNASTDHSNYLRTTFTLGGIFSMDYPLSDDPKTWNDTDNLYPEVFEHENAPPLVRRLHAIGYTGWHSATPWGGCSHRHLECLGTEQLLDADYVTQRFLAPTPFGRPLMHLVAEDNDAFLSISSRLPMLLASDTPYFIFAHNMAPHPPFTVDEDCRKRKWAGKNWNDWLAEDRNAYIGAVKCVNGQTERLVDVLAKFNPEAIIVLQSDHGSAFEVDWEKPLAQWSKTAITERSSFLNLIHAPEDCKQWLTGPLGQVNTIRFVMACLEGKAPVYLPEASYLSTYSEGEDKGKLRRAPQ